MLLLACPASFAGDVAGSADIKDLGRFAGSQIIEYQTQNYGKTVLATGPVTRKADIQNTSQAVEGELTRIVYRVPAGSSALEVFRNFEARIAKAGYSTLFSGGPDQINAYQFKYKHPVELLREYALGDKLWYLSAVKNAASGQVYVSVLVSPHASGELRVGVIRAVTKAMENRMVDAKAMQSAIADKGKVALYGIYFDTDSAKLQPTSKPTLEQIAALMHNAPKLAIIVVGHTDNQGGYEYNMKLSRQRAQAVATALTSDYGIAKARIRHAGVGYLAPAASNASEAGRALNRRVELVKQ